MSGRRKTLNAKLTAVSRRYAPHLIASSFEKREIRRFLVFLIVGGVNALFGYALFCALLYCGLHYAIAGLISTVLGVMFNFVTTGAIVFGNRHLWPAFRFASGYVLLYGVGVGEMKVAELLEFNLYLVSGLLLIPNALFAYWFNKKFVFPAVNLGS